jgi:hypothetical protein
MSGLLHNGTLMRWLIAGPLALIAAVAGMAALPHLVPEGAGGIDHLVFPVLAFPLIWAIAFFYACLDEKLPRAAAILTAATAAGIAVIAISNSA